MHDVTTNGHVITTAQRLLAASQFATPLVFLENLTIMLAPAPADGLDHASYLCFSVAIRAQSMVCLPSQLNSDSLR